MSKSNNEEKVSNDIVCTKSNDYSSYKVERSLTYKFDNNKN